MVKHLKVRIETRLRVKDWKGRVRSWQLSLITWALVAVILLSYVAFIYFPNRKQFLAYAKSDETAYSVDEALVSANTKFAFNFFRELVKEDENNNIFISPLSISTALTMTYNGAEDTTKDAISKVLEFGSMDQEKVNQEFANLIVSLEHADEQVKIMIGNSIWMKQEFEPMVKSSFIDQLKTFYNGEIFTRDFGNPETVDDINGWVEEETEGKITELIQTIEPELVMFIMNALYFKGDWIIEFDEAQIQKQDFFLPEGNTIQVDMMSTSGNFSYYSGEDFQAVRLPYGRDKLAMYIFLPHESTPLDTFIENLNQTSHEEYINQLRPVGNLAIKIPKFQVEYGVKRLNSVLEKLGMGIAFNQNSANFNGIASVSPENLYISYVDHKAVIEVNEKGTEATAATSVGIGVTSAPPSFIVNRPFFFEIRDDRSGSILFMGKIVNPAQD